MIRPSSRCEYRCKGDQRFVAGDGLHELYVRAGDDQARDGRMAQAMPAVAGVPEAGALKRSVFVPERLLTR